MYNLGILRFITAIDAAADAAHTPTWSVTIRSSDIHLGNWTFEPHEDNAACYRATPLEILQEIRPSKNL